MTDTPQRICSGCGAVEGATESAMGEILVCADGRLRCFRCWLGWSAMAPSEGDGAEGDTEDAAA